MLHKSSATAFAKHLVSLFLVFLIIMVFFSSVAAEPASRVSEFYSLPSHTFIITEDGSLWGWGDNRDGKLGDGTTMNRPIPVKSSLENVTALYPQSSGHTFALTDDGSLWAWERNWDGRIGAGRDANTFPEPVLILTGVSQIFPNERHSFALKSDGTLWAWGNNSHGQLGDGTTTSRFEPVLVELENIAEVVPKYNSTFAILDDGTLWAWGNNSYGKLGDGTTLNRSLPVQVLDNVDSVYPQRTHTLALDNNSILWSWGHNNYGQLGHGSGDNSQKPVRVDLQGIQEVFSLEYHTFALTSDNTLWAWGYNWYGQLGDGSVMNRSRPVQVDIDNVNELYPQQHHTFALKNDNSLWGWGRNWDGRIGDNSNSYNRSRPVLVAENISQAYPQDRHTYALSQDGTASAWGDNSKDQLGSGSGSSVNAPQQIPLEDISEIYAQENHAFAVKEDGSLWAWGRNNRGQLGTGNYENQSAPAEVLFGDNLPTFNVLLQADPDQGGILSGTGTYRQGETAVVSASENEGYTFINWTEKGEEVSTEKEFSFVVMRDWNLVANFDAPGETPSEPSEEKPEEEPEMYELALTANPEEGGTVSGAGSYEANTEITISAEAEEGYVFINWTEDDEEISDSAEYELTLNNDRSLTANFEPEEIDDREIYEVKLSASPEEAGQVFGSGEYRDGEEVTISAETEEGFEFVKWTEVIIEDNDEEGLEVGKYLDLSDDPEYSFKIDRDRVLIANFEEAVEESDTYNLELLAEPEGTGTLEGSGTYEEGEEVEISAAANTGYQFINWTYNEEEISSAAEFVYTMPAADLTFTAHFTAVETEPEIETVSAVNGVVTVDLDKNLSEAPETNDFSALYISSAEQQDQAATDDVYPEDDKEWENLELTDSSWDSDNADQVELYFTPFEAGDEDIDYTVKISFRDGDAVQAEPFTVEAEEPETFELELLADPEDGGTVEGSGIYEEGEEVEVSATAAEDYEFVNWTEGDEELSSDAQFTYTMTGEDTTLTANFMEVIDDPKLDAVSAVNGTIVLSFDQEFAEAPKINNFSALYISSISSINQDEPQWSNIELIEVSWDNENATQVELDFEPFDRTEEDIDYTIKVSYRDGDAVEAEPFTVEAEEPETFELELLAAPEDGGTVEGSGIYEEGDIVEVSANAAEDYEFVNWTEGDKELSSDAQFTYTMTGEDTTLTANFEEVPQEPEAFELELVANPEDGGTVEGSGIYEEGEDVNVSATAAKDYEFVNWTEGDAELSSDAQFTYTMTGEDTTLTANFEEVPQEPETFELELLADPEDGGTVEGSGIYEKGDKVEVSATAAENYKFVNWTEGDVELSSDAQFTYTMTGEDTTLAANFEEVPQEPETFELELLADPEDGGTVEGSGIYEEGDKVEVNASANEGYEFVNWTANDSEVSNVSSFTYDMPEEKVTLTANFEEIAEEPETYELTLVTDPSEGGTAKGSSQYEPGENVTLKASAAQGYEFIIWTIDGYTKSTEEVFDYTMPAEDVTIVAVFDEEVISNNGDNSESNNTESSNGDYESVREALESRSNQGGDVFYIEVSYHSEESALVTGEGYYEYGDQAVVNTTIPEGYEFYCWYEGDHIVSFDEKYVFTVNRDRSLTAWLEPEEVEEIYNISVEANPARGGETLGGGVYPADDDVVLQAVPGTRYDFVSWTENGTVVSSDTEYIFTATEDRSLKANFKLISYEGNQIDGEDDKYEYESEPFETNSTMSTSGSNSLYIPQSNGLKPADSYTISLYVEPKGYGEVLGAGDYDKNKLVGLDAIPREGYGFTGWLEDDEKVSMARSYAFLATEDRELVATFAPLKNRSSENAETFRISLAPSPLEGGRVYGRGEYTEGKTITVSALPNIDYDFVSWTENGQVVSTEIIYTFIVNKDYQLVANFAYYDSSDPDNPSSSYRYEFDSFLNGYFLDFITPYSNIYKERDPSAGSSYGWSPAYVPPVGGQ